MGKILIPCGADKTKALSFLTGFILSAGLGERLLPITNHIPKPLLPILGRPLLELILEKVSPFVDTIGVNLHHKKELIAEYVDNSPFKERVTLFYEEPILGTGGALKNAKALLSKGSFLVHNGDILSDVDLKRLIEFHRSSGNIATLAVHDYTQFNNLVIDESGLLKDVIARCPERSEGTPKQSQNTDYFASLAMTNKDIENRKRLAFTGIAVYEPGFLDLLPQGVSNILDAWLRAVDTGYKIGTIDVSGCYWTDIGAPSAYAAALVHALRASGETIYINSDVDCSDVEMDGYIVIERDCKLSGVKSLRNCILLPGSIVPSPPRRFGGRGEGQSLPRTCFGGEVEFLEQSCENCIICHDLRIDLNESEMLGFPKNEAPLIGVGGSDRRYYRRRKGAQSDIFVRYAENDGDFHRHIEFTQFFRRHNIPVPELIAVDYGNRTAVFEDLGDLSLYSWLKCKRETAQTEGMYSKALDILLELHTTVTEYVSECPLLQDRVFDYGDFRWETDYFMEQFVKKIKGMDIRDVDALSEEFHRLAVKAESFTKAIIHRDFQSQNIMVTRGIPRLIDYQGARMGPPAYDVTSILWEPYSRLDDGVRETLLNYYTLQMKKRLGERFKESDFNESLKVCRLQRHMQALGAYGFLSFVKGKRYFLKHIPEGLNLLKEGIMPVKSEYPSLYELVIRL